MKQETTATLLAINRRFYRERAEEFAAHRRAPWPGFARLLERLPTGPVLDVGCGEGRFGAALARARPGSPWLGVDHSGPLLARARLRRDLPKQRALVALDAASHPDALPRAAFAGAVVIGMLHHVPGEARRLALLRALAERLAVPGLLAVTLWRFRAAGRLRHLELPFEDLAIDAPDLEPGDALLSFGGRCDVPRYCHFADAAEIDRMIAAVPLRLKERFCADGREGDLNEYLLWERRA